VEEMVLVEVRRSTSKVQHRAFVPKPNLSLNKDNNPTDNGAIFDGFGNLAHVDFVVGCCLLV
jgi:hypothetical protein